MDEVSARWSVVIITRGHGRERGRVILLSGGAVLSDEAIDRTATRGLLGRERVNGATTTRFRIRPASEGCNFGLRIPRRRLRQIESGKVVRQNETGQGHFCQRRGRDGRSRVPSGGLRRDGPR